MDSKHGFICFISLVIAISATTEDIANTSSIFRNSESEKEKWTAEKHLIPEIIHRFDTEKLKDNLRYLSEQPHLAGTERDDELARFIRGRFEADGLDSAELISYRVLLSKPNSTNPNKIYLQRGNETLFESKHMEVPLRPEDQDPNFVHAYSAYTPAGTVTTSPGVGVVYVNYGTAEDFEELLQLGVNVSGHIVMARFGKNYRGNKVKNAENYGAIGMILFSDPNDVALEGTDPTMVYNNSWWLPGTGMQRGSYMINNGDPLTPGKPSTEYAYRLSLDEADLPKIPAQPIGYDDAAKILRYLDGDTVPQSWEGGIANITYRLGPNFIKEYQDVTLTLSTHNERKIYRSYNVIGTIRGEMEPDRYVLLGNHRDAWGFGAADPSSGTAQLLETARVFGSMLKEGWRPRRTLVFCSWGAEEFGLIGSTEWVEENIDKLQSRAVAYINTDTCAAGPMLHVKASHLLRGIFISVAQMIPGLQNSSRTLYEEWKNYHQQLNPSAPETPVIEILDSMSDHSTFYFDAGVPAADVRFRRDEIKYKISRFPTYHTGYDTFHMLSSFIDPDFSIIRECGLLSSLVLKYISDSSIIPYSINELPDAMFDALKTSPHRSLLMRIADDYVHLEEAVEKFQNVVHNFTETNKLNKNSYNLLQQRVVNDQLMSFEKSFLIPAGFPGQPSVRHAVFAPSKFDKYSGGQFPLLNDYLYDYDQLEGKEMIQREEDIKKHVSDLIIMTNRASGMLQNPIEFTHI